MKTFRYLLTMDRESTSESWLNFELTGINMDGQMTLASGRGPLEQIIECISGIVNDPKADDECLQKWIDHSRKFGDVVSQMHSFIDTVAEELNHNPESGKV